MPSTASTACAFFGSCEDSQSLFLGCVGMEEGVHGDDDRAAAPSREVAATPRWDCVSGEAPDPVSQCRSCV